MHTGSDFHDMAARLEARFLEGGAEAWSEAEPATGFLQSQPEEGAPASQKSEVRILYGQANLYIGASFYDEACDFIDDSVGAQNFLGGTESGDVPEGAAWVVVDNFAGAGSFALTIS